MDNEKFPMAQQMERLGKPKAKMVGKDGNIFNLIGIARQALHFYPAAYNEMWERINKSRSYHEALAIMAEYVDIE